MIRLRDVGKTVTLRGREVPILRGVSMDVAAGELLAVVGASGSGKSTLLNVLGLLDTASRGEYLLRGQDVATLSAKERDRCRARTFGFVFQAFHLMPTRTVLANVEVGRLYEGVSRAERVESAEAALESVGLAHRAQSPAGTLSGGEAQRAAIARAIAGRKDALLCDEPTGNLDSVSGARVLHLLRALHASGMTVVVITHDPRVAAACERVVEVRDGVLHGSSSELSEHA